MSTCLRISVLLSVLAIAGCSAPSKDPVAAPVPVADQPEPQADARAETVPAQRDGDTTLAVGQRLEVSLEGNPSTGYSWEIEADGAPVLSPAPSPAVADAAVDDGTPPRVGSPVTRQWHFEAMQPGATVVRLVYRRPWEKDVAPIEQAEFRVMVEEASPQP